MTEPHDRAGNEYTNGKQDGWPLQDDPALAYTVHAQRPVGRGQSYEDALTLAAYLVLAAIFGAGLLLGLLVGAWIW